MAHARIGRIRMKDGGAEVRVLRQERTDPGINGGMENWRGDIERCARNCVGYARPDSPLVGFVVVGLFGDGMVSMGWRHDADRSPIPRSLLPAYVAEQIRRDLVTHVETVETYNRLRD